MNKNIQCETYSDKAILVTGDTRECKEDLKALGGKWNGKLVGWIFSKKLEGNVRKFIETGEIVKFSFEKSNTIERMQREFDALKLRVSELEKLVNER